MSVNNLIENATDELTDMGDTIARLDKISYNLSCLLDDVDSVASESAQSILSITRNLEDAISELSSVQDKQDALEDEIAELRERLQELE